MKVLVTGSDGFIGKHVFEAAEKRGHVVDGIDKSRVDMSVLPAYWYKDYDCVIHLAAYIDIKESFEKPWEYTENNLVLLRKLKQAKRVVFASSAAVYSEASPYGLTKKLGEYLLPKNSVSLRIFNPFGPGENHANETHIIPILAGNEITTLYHKGKQIRDFIDVRDVAEAFVLAAESNISGAYDLCNTPLSIREVASLMNRSVELVDDGRDPGDTMKLVGNKKPLQEKLNWKPKHNVKEEIRNFLNW